VLELLAGGLEVRGALAVGERATTSVVTGHGGLLCGRDGPAPGARADPLAPARPSRGVPAFGRRVGPPPRPDRLPGVGGFLAGLDVPGVALRAGEGSRTGTSARVSGVSGMTVCTVAREVATR
jgi:hypothetical protein